MDAHSLPELRISAAPCLALLAQSRCLLPDRLPAHPHRAGAVHNNLIRHEFWIRVLPFRKGLSGAL